MTTQRREPAGYAAGYKHSIGGLLCCAVCRDFRPVCAGYLSSFAFGYVCYDTIHYATHHFAMKRGVWLWLKQYHLRHHYKDDHAGYGVSSPLWDYVFRTTRK